MTTAELLFAWIIVSGVLLGVAIVVILNALEKRR